MLKILNSQQIRELDTYTIKHTPVESIVLMEHACQAFVQWFTERYDASHKIGIICGTGNNGGDGLGIARLLTDWGYPIKLWIVRGTVKETDDFKINFGRLPETIKVIDFLSGPPDIFSDRHILIDAIFGSGLSRPAEGIYALAIQAINESSKVCVAVDVPSGLFADKHSEGAIVNADFTVSFELPKLAFMLPENYSYVGSWHIVDIGLSKAFVKDVTTGRYYLEKKSVKKILKQRSTFDHKGDHGRALLMAGSFGKMGAAVLAARAALRAGVGLLTVHVPKQGYLIIQSNVPEAMASIDANEDILTSHPPLDSFDAVGIGPGIGQSEKTVAALKELLISFKQLVIDADALNILGSHRDLLRAIPPGCILTPHPKEFERIVGPWTNDFERLEKLVKLAKETQSTIILKGAHTSIASAYGEVHFNSTGNPGMATGGSGDVLTGMLTGLLAQKYSSEDAAILGVYLHGLAGDLAAREKGMNSLIASDIIDFLPAAFKDLARA